MRAKYDPIIFEHPPASTPERLEARLALRDEMDQHFARASFDFLAGMHARRVLDARTRHLVLIGQFAITRSHGHLEDELRAALTSGEATPRDALESILQCQIYGGDTVLEPAIQIFATVADELGRRAELRDDQLPLDGHDAERFLDDERKGWAAVDAADPRLEDLIARHGWLGVSTGLRYRPGHHLEILSHLDTIDPEFAHLWERFAYQDMYSRWVLDDRTRSLCTVGDLVAIGAATSAREHMRAAMAADASPREVLEVVLLSGPYFGFHGMTASLRVLEALLEEQGRLDEIGAPPKHPYDAKGR